MFKRWGSIHPVIPALSRQRQADPEAPWPAITAEFVNSGDSEKAPVQKQSQEGSRTTSSASGLHAYAYACVRTHRCAHPHEHTHRTARHTHEKTSQLHSDTCTPCPSARRPDNKCPEPLSVDMCRQNKDPLRVPKSLPPYPAPQITDTGIVCVIHQGWR